VRQDGTKGWQWFSSGKGDGKWRTMKDARNVPAQDGRANEIYIEVYPGSSGWLDLDDIVITAP